MHSTQRGFTFITVLILTSMISVIVLSTMRDNFIQERLTGNYQKKMNARLVSEKGIFDTHARVLQEMAENPSSTLQQLINDTLGESSHITGRAQTDDMTYATSLNVNSDGLLEFSSDGTRFEGKNNTVALFELVSGGASSTFASGVIGCDGVTLGASGIIDSYDSSQGNYGGASAYSDSSVTTIHHDADVNLTGGASIWGSVSATGSISITGGTAVYGDVHANLDITVNSGPRTEVNLSTIPAEFDVSTTVGGDVLSGRNVRLINNKVAGVVRAEGNFFLSDDGEVEVLNSENNGLDIMYGGTFSFGGNEMPLRHEQDGFGYDHRRYLDMPNVPTVPGIDPDNLPAGHDPQDPAKNCDPIDIADLLNGYDEPGLSRVLLNKSDAFIGPYVYQLTPASGQTYGNWPNWARSSSPGDILPVMEALPTGDFKPFYKFDSLTVSGGGLKISGGDVFIYVRNDFKLINSGFLTIDSGSSLTVFVGGKTEIRLPINQDQGITASGQPVFSVYSSYSGADGFKIASDAEIYAAVYAPLTNASIAGAGSLMGSIRAKTVNLSGDTAIHYDNRLGEIGNVNTCCGTTRLVFKGWKYK